jgi:hypothetical protein
MYPRKTRQMVLTGGVKPAYYAERYYTVAGSTLTLVSKLQYISKGAAGGWPGADWLATLGPGHAMFETQVIEEKQEEKHETKPVVHHAPAHHTSGTHKSAGEF